MAGAESLPHVLLAHEFRRAAPWNIRGSGYRWRDRRGNSARRQELILTATLSGLHGVATSPRIIPLIGALQGHLLTNVGLSDGRRLAALVAEMDSASTQRVIVDQSNFMYIQSVPGGDEILLPRSGDYTALRQYLAATLAGG